MNALVTGGGGFLGLHIVEQLVERGDAVRVLCRRPNPRFGELGVEWHGGDVRDFDTVLAACEGIDVVFHVAALPGIWGPWKDYYSINTLGTEVVVEACRRMGVARLVYTSSASVVFDENDHLDADETLPYADRYLCHYPQTKALAERAVLRANGTGGLSTVALRPHLIWGPRDNHLTPRVIERARRGRLRQVGDGTNRVSLSYVENVAAAHLQAADALKPGSPVAGQAYFINDAEPVNLWQWINGLLERAGLPPVRRKTSTAAAWRWGAFYELLYRSLRLSGEPPMTRFLARQLSQSHCYRIDKAHRDFGYQPTVSIETGLARLDPELRQLASLPSGKSG
ncbi:MAG: NAD-dependent epimerase/dehydratase family protein [Planctomycetes bacterium]|nr:NAD-dependent epimerase/dehydratase family protein [Planctomycetota bacterium]